MRFSAVVTLASVVAGTWAVNQATYDALAYHFKFAAGAYATSCPHPNGQTLVTTLYDASSATSGYIARDDVKQEFVVAFRGTSRIQPSRVASDSTLVPFPGIGGQFPPHVHKGLITAFSNLKQTIVSTINASLNANNGQYAHYTLVAVGHDTGGSLAAFTGVTFRQTFFENLSRVYTYGQPRTGDLEWAFLVDEMMGFSVFRSVNKADGVPKSIPLNIEGGYVHHPVEYWTSADPPSAANTVQCREFGDQVVGEDELCSLSVTTSVAADHTKYFGVEITSLTPPFCA